MASSIELDYYAILEIDYTASEKEIRKAYRKKSLTCHPDKVGPDDEKAANTFHLINLAVDALTDPVKRKLYDDLHKAERMRKERFNDMNAARRAERTKLEEREQAAKKAKHEHLSKDAQDKLEMERIREEGVQKMLARSEIKRQEMASSMNRAQQIKDANEVIKNASVADCTIKIKWSKELSGAVDEVRIRNSFSTYGIIDKVLMGKSGKRNAVLVFKNVQDSFKAMNDQKLVLCDFKLEPLTKPEPLAFQSLRILSDANYDHSQNYIHSSKANKGEEYESYTLNKLRENERERLRNELLNAEK